MKPSAPAILAEGRPECPRHVPRSESENGLPLRPGAMTSRSALSGGIRPERLDEEELADWRNCRNAVYQLAALTGGARLAGRRRIS